MEKKLITSAGMLYRQDLRETWLRRVARGDMINRILDHAGRNLEAGLRIENGVPEYFARDVDTGQDLRVKVLERELGGGATIQYNEIRGLKPQGRVLGPGPQPDIPTDPAKCGADCMNPGAALSLYRREPLARFESGGRAWLALSNAFPMNKHWHTIWVPVRAAGMLTVLPHRPQAPLDEQTVTDFMALAQATEGTVTFYNSPGGGGASMDHLHLQSIAGGRLAIQGAQVATAGHFKVLAGFATNAVCFGPEDSRSAVWATVEACQSLGPLNLISIGKQTYLVPRNPHHAVVEEFPGSVLGALEMAGRFFTADLAVYERATREMIESAVRKASLPLEQLRAVLERVQLRSNA